MSERQEVRRLGGKGVTEGKGESLTRLLLYFVVVFEPSDVRLRDAARLAV